MLEKYVEVIKDVCKPQPLIKLVSLVTLNVKNGKLMNIKDFNQMIRLPIISINVIVHVKKLVNHLIYINKSINVWLLKLVKPKTDYE